MTASRVLAEMPAAEWDVWLARSHTVQVGSRQHDYRAAVVAGSLGGGRDALDLFPSLRPTPDRSARSFRLWALARAPGRATSEDAP